MTHHVEGILEDQNLGHQHCLSPILICLVALKINLYIKTFYSVQKVNVLVTSVWRPPTTGYSVLGLHPALCATM
jgi:hypothetical protein